MKVVYKPSVLEQLTRIRHTAMQENRQVEYVSLDLKEARELGRELRVCSIMQRTSEFESWLNELEATGRTSSPQPIVTCLGLNIKVQP